MNVIDRIIKNIYYFCMSLLKHLIEVPIQWMVGLFILSVVLWILFWYKLVHKKISFKIGFARIFLLQYLYMIVVSTVLARPSTDTYQIELHLFWSYMNAIKLKSQFALWQGFSNIIMTVPLGCLLPLSLGREIKLKDICFFGSLFSLLIEFFQLVLRKGLFEFDDIFHNTIGAVIGYLVYKFYVDKVKKKCWLKS